MKVDPLVIEDVMARARCGEAASVHIALVLRSEPGEPAPDPAVSAAVARAIREERRPAGG